MAKLDDLMRSRGGNAAESLGVGVARNPAPAPGDGAGLAVPARLQGVTRARNVAEIALDKVERDPGQPREEFDPEALARLAESIRTRGQLQPIRVRWDEGRGVYVVIAGERRWRAAAMAGLAAVSAVIVEGDVPPAELLAVQLVENCLREDLRPVEQARAFRTLMDRNGWSIRRLADELALDHSAVGKALKLLELPAPVREQVDQGALAATTAYEIAKVDDPVARDDLARRAVAEGLTVADVKAARGKGEPLRTRKLEHKDRNGFKVTVTVPDGYDDDDAVAFVQRALKEWRKSRPGSHPA
ncbi:MAG: ParB/RepB/Spo0J family partition protein [Planctomycetia bacterium]|nr:ParB/RepB/Spo0J family partition protein [Planctomycetia bacterium]